MDANVYQHFRADERSFIDSVGDWIEQVQGQYAPYLTDFLDPRQSYILETLVRQETELRYSPNIINLKMRILKFHYMRFTIQANLPV